MTSRITWSEGKHEIHTGHVGSIKLFQIHWGCVNGDPLPWKLRSELPITTTYKGAASVDEAKQAAESLLVTFIQLLGARFQEED